MFVVQTVKALVDKINAAGGSAELFVYEGCGHGFMNKGEEIKKKMQSGGMKVIPAVWWSVG